jgi:hypothetical protein
METGEPLKRRHAVALGLILAEILFIVWYFQYLPMVDLPQHMLTAKVLTHYDDASTAYSEFFTRKFPWNPYSSYFWFVMALEPAIGLPNATRLYLSFALLLTVVAFGFWMRQVLPGRDALMIPATLLLLGLFFFIGLINYLFSVPFMFLSFALSSKLARLKRTDIHRLLAPPHSTEVWLSLALLVTYFSHIVTFVITLFVVAAQQLITYRGRGLTPLCRAAAPSLALLAIYMTAGLSSDVSGMSWSYEPFLKRLEYLLMPFTIFFDVLQPVWVYQPQAVLSWLGFAALAIIGGKGKTPAKRGAAALVAALLVASTLFFPSLIAASSGALRLSYPASLALLSLMPTGWDERRVLRWVAVAVFALNPLLLGYNVAEFQKEMAGLEKVIEAIPERQVIQPVITELHSARFHTYPFLHVAAWYNYYKGGTNPYLFARVAHFPIKERRQVIRNAPGDWSAASFRYDQHQEGTDYFLVRTRRADIIEDLSRHVPLVVRSGDWMAFGPNPK